MDIVADWFEEATKLKAGEALYIPANSKKDALQSQRAFTKHKQAVLKIAPEKAYLISVRSVFLAEEKQHYVVLEKTATSPFLAMKRSQDGVSTVSISSKIGERERRRSLMLRDGISMEEIEAMEKAEDAIDTSEYEPGKGE